MTKRIVKQRLTKKRINLLRYLYKNLIKVGTFNSPFMAFLLAEADVLFDLAIVGVENTDGKVMSPGPEVNEYSKRMGRVRPF